MSDYFGDASYWIAQIDPDDELHRQSQEYATLIALENRRVVTTQLVLNEVLNPRSGTTARQRRAAIELVDRIGRDTRVDIVPQSPEQFAEALNVLRTAVDDKEWSITDCASFLTMRQFSIQEVLTSDRHFAQAGFTVMLNRVRI